MALVRGQTLLMPWDPYYCHENFTSLPISIPDCDTNHIITPAVAGAHATLWLQRWRCICTSCHDPDNATHEFNWDMPDCRLENCGYQPNASKPNVHVNVLAYWKFEAGVLEEYKDTLHTGDPSNEAETVDKIKDLFNVHQTERFAEMNRWGLNATGGHGCITGSCGGGEEREVSWGSTSSLIAQEGDEEDEELGEGLRVFHTPGAQLTGSKACNSCNRNETHITSVAAQICIPKWPVGQNDGLSEKGCPERVDPEDAWGQTTPSKNNSGEWLMTEPGYKATSEEALECPPCTKKWSDPNLCQFWGGTNNDKYCADWSIPDNCESFSFPEMETVLGGEGSMTQRLIWKMNELEGDPCNTCTTTTRRNADGTECWNTASLKWTLPHDAGGGHQGHTDCWNYGRWNSGKDSCSPHDSSTGCGGRKFGWDPYCHDANSAVTFNHVRDYIRDGRRGTNGFPRNGMPMIGLFPAIANNYNIPYSQQYNAQYIVVGRNAEAAWKGRLTKGWSPFRLAASVLKCHEGDTFTVRGNTFVGPPFDPTDGVWCDGAVTRTMLDTWFREIFTDVRLAVVRGNKACDPGHSDTDRSHSRNSDGTQHSACTACEAAPA